LQQYLQDFCQPFKGALALLGTLKLGALRKGGGWRLRAAKGQRLAAAPSSSSSSCASELRFPERVPLPSPPAPVFTA